MPGHPLAGTTRLSLSDRLKPWAVIEGRLRAVAAADLALAIYNPASRTRREQIIGGRGILLEVRAPRRPRSSAACRPRGEDLTVTTLGASTPTAWI